MEKAYNSFVGITLLVLGLVAVILGIDLVNFYSTSGKDKITVKSTRDECTKNHCSLIINTENNDWYSVNQDILLGVSDLKVNELRSKIQVGKTYEINYTGFTGEGRSLGLMSSIKSITELTEVN